MSGRSGRNPARVLWFVAAALATIAAAVGYFRKGEVRWSLLAAAVFLAAMGLGAASARGRRGVQLAPAADERASGDSETRR